MIRRATIFLLFAYLTGLSVTPPAGDEETDKIIRSAVKIIEDHYLYTRSNTFWNAAKERLLKGGYKDKEGACRGLSRELATLGDSELNGVSKAQLAELQKETAGERMGIAVLGTHGGATRPYCGPPMRCGSILFTQVPKTPLGARL